LKRLLSTLLLSLLCAATLRAQVVPGGVGIGGTVSGQIQTATGGAITNGTLTFTLSQTAIVANTATIATLPVACYTSASGNISGVPDPVPLPLVSVNLASGSVPAGTYYLKTFYYNLSGNSASSPEAKIVLSAPGTIIVNPPALQPSSATGYGVSISTTPGAEIIQNTVVGWTQFQQSSSPLLSGTAAPTVNTSSCNIYFSDQLVPTGTYYSVNLLNKNGSQVAGFPQTWCTYGGAGGVINVSQGAPTGNCNVRGVFYPTPIFANTPSGTPQSINTDLQIGGNLTVNGAAALHGALSGLSSINSIQFATGCTGSDIFAQANACASTLTPPGVVVIPPGTYGGVTTTLNGVTGVIFLAYGATVNFTPTSGNAMAFKSVQNSGIFGLTLNGPNSGTAVALYVGNAVNGAGQTLYNVFSDLQIGGSDATVTTAGFKYGVQCDGTVGAGTYTNNFHNVHVYAPLTAGWYFKPTTPLYCNANVIDGSSYVQHSAGDGLVLDGAYGNTFSGFRAETNTGWGANLGPTQQTNYNQFLGGWFESNTLGDFSLSATASENQIYGTNAASITPVVNSLSNFGNVVQLTNGIQGQSHQFYGFNNTWTVNSQSPGVNSKTIFQFFNGESPSSGCLTPFSWFRTSANSGAMELGCPEYPVQLFSKITIYNGLVTVGNGVASEVAARDLTAQTSNIVGNTLFTPAADGQFRLTWNAKVTTVAGVTSTLGPLTVTYVDPDGVSQTITAAAQIAAGTIATTSTANTTATVLLGIPLILNCKGAAAIQFAFGYASNAANAMNYNLHIRLEAE
jgi:hypothetical protein